MIETLTPEQEALIPIVRDEWINRLDSCPKIDREAAISGMKWLYKISDLKEPEVVIVDSPLSAVVLYSLLKNGADSVEAATKKLEEINIADVQTGKTKLELHYPDWGWYGRVDDFGWSARFDYWERAGVDLNCPNWESWKRFITSGVYMSIQTVDVAIICQMPKFLKRWKPREALHCETGPAIGWADGYELYRLWGVHFDKELHTKITSKSITQKEVFAINNQEQRQAALRFLWAEYLLTSENSTLVDTSAKGDELYEVTGVVDEILYCVKYKCPSTARVYIDFVHPDIGKKHDATLAMASKGRLTKFQLEHCVVNHT